MNRRWVSALVWLWGCAWQAQSSAEVAGPETDAGGMAEHCRLAADFSARHGGRAMLVLVDGDTACERYDNGASVGEAIYLYDATSGFWGVAVAAMIEDGLVSSFDERVADTVTEWKSDERKSKITLRQLLNLTSGLSPIQEPRRDARASDDHDYAAGLGTIDDPGQRFSYGLNHYAVLGEWLERKLAAQGQSSLEYVERRILVPIDAPVERWQHDPAGVHSLPDGAYVTARHWARFGQLLLQRGAWEGRQIVREDLLAECVVGSPANPGYGLTLWLNRPGGRGPETSDDRESMSAAGFIYPDGHPDMFMAASVGNNVLYVVPTLNMVVVRQATGDTGGGYSHAAFLTRLLTGGRSDRNGATPAQTSHLGSLQARAVWLVTRFDEDGDLKLSRSEVPDQMTRLIREFDRLDNDGDGRLSVGELVQIERSGADEHGGSTPDTVTSPDGQRGEER